MLVLMPHRPCTIWALCSSRVAASPGTTNRCGLNLLRADAGCGFAREKEFALHGSTRTFTHSSSRTLRVYTKCFRRRICTFPFCRSVRLSSGSRVELNMGEQTAWSHEQYSYTTVTPCLFIISPHHSAYFDVSIYADAHYAFHIHTVKSPSPPPAPLLHSFQPCR